jgi:hypothetical protein
LGKKVNSTPFRIFDALFFFSSLNFTVNHIICKKYIFHEFYLTCITPYFLSGNFLRFHILFYLDLHIPYFRECRFFLRNSRNIDVYIPIKIISMSMWLGTGNLSMVSLETSFQLSFARNKNAFFFWKMPISAFETLIKKLNKINKF